MKSLAISLLGGMQVALDGKPISAFESDKVRALLAYLVVERDQLHRREQLTGLLWSDQSETIARHSLSQALYNLRQVLGESGRIGDHSRAAPKGRAEPYLMVTPHTVQFNPRSRLWLDVQTFTELVNDSQRHAHVRRESCSKCAQWLAEAARICRGDFLAGFSIHTTTTFDEWILVQRERLHLQLVKVLAFLAQYEFNAGELIQALEFARRQVALDPLGDASHRQLMRLLAMNGERTAAMVQTAYFEHLLEKELGIAPELETLALKERLRLEGETGMSLGNLPAQLTPLVGRKAEQAELMTQIQDPAARLISLLGPGGCGKTRMALEAGKNLSYFFTHGVYLVSLSALSSSTSLFPTIGEALGIKFRESSDPQVQLQDYLRARQLLLILDSFETVPEAAQDVVMLLRAAPGVKVLVTTRTRINVTDEQVFPLGGMLLVDTNDPDQALQSDAVQLFQAGARRVRPDFVLDAGNIVEVGRICRLVSGMPLGLLLAAAWVGSLTPAEIAREIERSLDFLSADWADVPKRQKSMRATLDYSWQLLGETDRQLLDSLSIFRGGFTLETARAVLGANPKQIRSLVEQTLVQSEPAERYRLHDLIQQYAAEKIACHPVREERVRNLHSQYFLKQAITWGQELKSSRQRQILAFMDQEINNLRAAWEWAAWQGDAEALEGALEGLCIYYLLRVRYPEGKAACELALTQLNALNLPETNWCLKTWLMAWQARFLCLGGQIEVALQLRVECRRQLELAHAGGQDLRRAEALLCNEEGNEAADLKIGYPNLLRSIDLYKGINERWWVAASLRQASEYAHRIGEHQAATRIEEECVDIYRSLNETRGLGRALINLAYSRVISNRIAEGLAIMHEALECFEAAGDLASSAESKVHFGVILSWAGRQIEAIEMLKQGLPHLLEFGNRYHYAYGTLALGMSAMFLGDYHTAQRDLLHALDCTQRDGLKREEAALYIGLGCNALVLGDTTRAGELLLRSVALYREMHYQGELGWALGGLALTQRFMCQSNQAWESLREAFQIAVQGHSMFTSMTIWPAAMLLFADLGMMEQAYLAYRAALGTTTIGDTPWLEDIAGRHVQQVTAVLPPEVRQSIEQHARESDLFAIAAELLRYMPE